MMSFSSVEATAKGGVFLYPQGFNLDTYAKVFKDPSITLDREELSVAEWFDRASLPETPNLISLTGPLLFHV